MVRGGPGRTVRRGRYADDGLPPNGPPPNGRYAVGYQRGLQVLLLQAFSAIFLTFWYSPQE